ncbi:MAG: hypothetical protein LBS37_03790 [Treponema sp.]|jgi:hypothetical protein|nr:hypothetical protein [Treponema sp.]
MSFFCLLWVPLLYLFRHSITAEGGAGGVWALLLGSLTAIFQFFLGSLVDPGAFGFSRWLYGFVDVIALPVLVPFAVYLLLILCRALSGPPDFAHFILLWLIPVAALRAVSWSSLNDPLLLVIAPLLWTALAVGIPFFTGFIIRRFRWYIVIPSGLCAAALPLAAASSYWALFSQRPVPGFSLFAAVLMPMIISLLIDFINAE